MDAVNPSELQSHSGGLEEARLRALVQENPGNFDAWTLLIKEIEKTSPNDSERIFSVYDAFLSEFPLCYGYWKKYADHRSRLCTIDKVVEVYERAVRTATYSVGLWVNYCSFGMLSFEDPVDIRRLFERALSFVGKDYLCHHLWDKYIEFEYSQKQWSNLAHIYLRSLRFPTKKLHMYHKSFERLVSICEEEMKYQDIDATNVSSQLLSNSRITEVKAYKDQEISSVTEDLTAPSVGVAIPNTLNKYVSAGSYLYEKASELDSKIKCFENHIRRPYFHIKPLDDDQLENWHHYLDLVEMQGDFDWTVKLYERCLIPCANYPEFWIRYVEFVEAKGGREIANLALVRATDVFLKRVPGFHLFCARFKEQIGDISGARAAFLQYGSDLEPNFIENVARNANMEKRLGNVEAALIVYEKAIDVAKEKQNSHTLGNLYAQFSHFTYVVTASSDAARDVLIKGIQHLPQCKLLLERLIHFEMMHGGPRKIEALDSIIAEATVPVTDALQGLSISDREDISKLFLEFVDFCGSIHEIKKAWDRHRKLFPFQLRASSSYDHMTSRNGYADNTKTGGNDNPAILPHHASVDKHTECSAHHSFVNDTSLQKNTDTQSDLAITDQSNLEKTDDDLKEALQQVQSAIVVQEGPKSDTAEEHVVVYDSVHEDVIHPQAIQTEENAEVSKQVQIKHDQKPQDDDLIPTSLEKLSINPQEDGFQQTSPTLSLDCSAPDGSSMSNGNGPPDGDTTSEIVIPHSTCMQSNISPQRNLQEQNDHVLVESDPNSQKQLQTQSKTDSQQMVRSSTVDGGHSRQLKYTRQDQRDPRPRGYAEPQKRRQRQASQRSQYPTAGMQPQMLTGQGYPCQPQVWQNQQAQQTNLAPNQYQVGTGQVYPTSTHVWPAQNVQPQILASVSQGQPNTQPISHPQAQVYQYPYQSNQGFTSQMQSMQGFTPQMQSSQGFTPQMWDYYQQHQQQLQQYQLQQQHQNQQLQVQQQQPPQQQLQLQQQQVQQQQPPQQQLHLQQQQYHLQQIQPQQVQQQLPVQQQPPQQQVHQQQQQQIQPQELLPLEQPPPQQLHPQQEQPPLQLYPQQQQQYHLQQQQQQQLQMWNYNYYSQAFPVQYYDSSQYGQDYGQQVIGSQGQVASQHDVEQSSGSSHADPPQQQVPSSQ